MKNKAFTIIELLVVITILAIVSIIGFTLIHYAKDFSPQRSTCSQTGVLEDFQLSLQSNGWSANMVVRFQDGTIFRVLVDKNFPIDVKKGQRYKFTYDNDNYLKKIEWEQ